MPSRAQVRSENIRNRHSTRFFLPDSVSDADLDAMLTAGSMAPSSKNEQPWYVVVVRQPSLGKICDTVSERLNRDSCGNGPNTTACRTTVSTMRSAPACFFVYCDKPRDSRFEVRLLSIGAMIENMALEAECRGISTLWCCDAIDTFEEALAMSHESRWLVSALAVGHGDDAYRAVKKTVTEIAGVLQDDGSREVRPWGDD